MVNNAPPPLLRDLKLQPSCIALARTFDAVIDALEALERYARAFDEISREQDAHYSARSFVRWVRLEATTPPRASRVGPRQRRAAEAA